MSQYITTAFVNQFRDNVALLCQQEMSYLREACTLKTDVSGEFWYEDGIAPTAAVKGRVRHGDTQYANTVHIRRRGTIWDFTWADLVDEEDKLRTLIDPQSDYSRNAAMAFGRSIDDEIISALGATVYTGKEGTVAHAFGYDPADPTAATVLSPLGNATANSLGYAMTVPTKAGTSTYIGANADNGTTNDGISPNNLLVAKLGYAKQLLDKNEVSKDETRYFVCTSSQLASMLRQTKVTSADYAAVKALVNGEVDTFMGFKFIRSERLPEVSWVMGTQGGTANVRVCYAFTKSAIKLAMGKEITPRVDVLPTKNYATQVHLKMTCGALRMNEQAVVRVLCNESSTYASET